MRRWLAGHPPVPDWARANVEVIKRRTAAAVQEIIDRAANGPTLLVVPRTDEEMWELRPETRPFPARWWRHITYRAAEAIPGAQVMYQDEVSIEVSPECAEGDHADCDGLGLDMYILSTNGMPCPCECHDSPATADDRPGPQRLV